MQQVLHSNKEARKRLTESNGTPAMDLGHMDIDLTYTFAYSFEDIRIRRHTNKRGIEQNTNASWQINIGYANFFMSSLMLWLWGVLVFILILVMSVLVTWVHIQSGNDVGVGTYSN